MTIGVSRNQIPLEQGLRLREIAIIKRLFFKQKPNSIRTRIKTFIFSPYSTNQKSRNQIPLEQGLRLYSFLPNTIKRKIAETKFH